MAHTEEPYVRIIEHPASWAHKFRYARELYHEGTFRLRGTIPGVNSTRDNPTYPTIEIKLCGHRGGVVVVASCVTSEPPYRSHPHKLVGDHCGDRGVCKLEVQALGKRDTCQVQFRRMGVQCVKRDEVAASIDLRRNLNVNPFNRGYNYEGFDLNTVRLCFQVFFTDAEGNVTTCLRPVVSDIMHKTPLSELQIIRPSAVSGPLAGGTEVYLFCEKLPSPEDMQVEVWFFQEENGAEVWSHRAEITYVHKQCAIVFVTPPYRDQNINHNVNVKFRLQVPDVARSRPSNFEYFPSTELTDEQVIEEKQQKLLLLPLLQQLPYSLLQLSHLQQLLLDLHQQLPHLQQQLPNLQQQLPHLLPSQQLSENSPTTNTDKPSASIANRASTSIAHTNNDSTVKVACTVATDISSSLAYRRTSTSEIATSADEANVNWSYMSVTDPAVDTDRLHSLQQQQGNSDNMPSATTTDMPKPRKACSPSNRVPKVSTTSTYTPSAKENGASKSMAHSNNDSINVPCTTATDISSSLAYRRSTSTTSTAAIASPADEANVNWSYMSVNDPVVDTDWLPNLQIDQLLAVPPIQAGDEDSQEQDVSKLIDELADMYESL